MNSNHFIYLTELNLQKTVENKRLNNLKLFFTEHILIIFTTK